MNNNIIRNEEDVSEPWCPNCHATLSDQMALKEIKKLRKCIEERGCDCGDLSPVDIMIQMAELMAEVMNRECPELVEQYTEEDPHTDMEKVATLKKMVDDGLLDGEAVEESLSEDPDCDNCDNNEGDCCSKKCDVKGPYPVTLSDGTVCMSGRWPEDMAEKPHPMLCFTHGGSTTGDEINEEYGFTCPTCQKNFDETNEKFLKLLNESNRVYADSEMTGSLIDEVSEIENLKNPELVSSLVEEMSQNAESSYEVEAIKKIRGEFQHCEQSTEIGRIYPKDNIVEFKTGIEFPSDDTTADFYITCKKCNTENSAVIIIGNDGSNVAFCMACGHQTNYEGKAKVCLTPNHLVLCKDGQFRPVKDAIGDSPFIMKLATHTKRGDDWDEDFISDIEKLFKGEKIEAPKFKKVDKEVADEFLAELKAIDEPKGKLVWTVTQESIEDVVPNEFQEKCIEHSLVQEFKDAMEKKKPWIVDKKED